MEIFLSSSVASSFFLLSPLRKKKANQEKRFAGVRNEWWLIGNVCREFYAKWGEEESAKAKWLRRGERDEKFTLETDLRKFIT